MRARDFGGGGGARARALGATLPATPRSAGIESLAVYNKTYAPVVGEVICYVDSATGGVTGVSASGSRACPGDAVVIPVGDGRVTSVKVAFSPKNYVRSGRREEGRVVW